jgi:hypothetical protein
MNGSFLSVFLSASLVTLPAMAAEKLCTPGAKEREMSADLPCTWIARPDGACACRIVRSTNPSIWRNPPVVPLPITPGTPGINNFPRAPGRQLSAGEEPTGTLSEANIARPSLLGQEKVQLLTPDEYRNVYPKLKVGPDGLTNLDDIARELGKPGGGLVKDGARVALPVNSTGR